MENLNRMRKLLLDENGAPKSTEYKCGIHGMVTKEVDNVSGELYMLKSAEFLVISISENADVDLTVRSLRDGLKNCQAVADSIWEKLNTGNWKDAPIYLRHLFSHASLVKAFILFSVSYHGDKTDSEHSLEDMRAALKTVDLGILLGMPTSDLTTAAQIIMQELNELSSRKGSRDVVSDHPNKKVRVDAPEMRDNPRHNSHEVSNEDSTSITFESVRRPWREWGQPRMVPVLFRPSLERFHVEHYLPKLPSVLQGCLDHWPALLLWSPSYLVQIAGDRTVPVEVGPSYVHPMWGQKLMAIGEFVKQHMECEQRSSDHASQPIGYLAQHPLFDQVPELRGDIKVPDYCCLSEESDSDVEPDINAWFGPKGTVSPLHHDPKHNLLAQVVGAKRVILYSSDDSEYLHPYEGQLLSNTSQVNLEDPKVLEKFPDIASAQAWECEIHAGDMLYIPRHWWHHVRSLSTSFSVSFWW